MVQHKLLSPDEYAPYMAAYLSTVGDVNLVEELEISVHRFIRFVRDIPMDKYDYRYAEGKWTIKDIIQHLIDVERVFSYRAMAFARGEVQALPGFDEQAYAREALGHKRHLTSLLSEFSEVRHASITLFKGFSPELLLRKGTANGASVSVRAIGFALIGHQNHHQAVFQERYLP